MEKNDRRTNLTVQSRSGHQKGDSGKFCSLQLRTSPSHAFTLPLCDSGKPKISGHASLAIHGDASNHSARNASTEEGATHSPRRESLTIAIGLTVTIFAYCRHTILVLCKCQERKPLHPPAAVQLYVSSERSHPLQTLYFITWASPLMLRSAITELCRHRSLHRPV